MTNERDAADDQWFGDMMILQVLADSATVNDQEREVLQRWLAAAERPSQAAAQEPKINYSVLHEWAEDWNIDYNGLCRTVRAAVAAPLDAATARDAARYRWLTDDHADPATREKCRELLYRMPVMSYAAASNAIDIAMQEGAEE